MTKQDRLIKLLAEDVKVRKEEIKLMRHLREVLWLGNYDERMQEMFRRMDLAEGSQELRDKKMLAIEKYLGIKFGEGYEYKLKKKK